VDLIKAGIFAAIIPSLELMLDMSLSFNAYDTWHLLIGSAILQRLLGLFCGFTNYEASVSIMTFPSLHLFFDCCF